MGEEQNNGQKKSKNFLKEVARRYVVIVIAVALIIFCIVALVASYITLEDDFQDVSEKNETYQISMNSQGQPMVVRILADGSEEEVSIDEMSEDLADSLEEYIDGDEQYKKEKIRYLIEAEIVTKYPYIDSYGGVTGDKNIPINGQVKIYRYQNEAQANAMYVGAGTENERLNESCRITFVNSEEFNKLIEAYESNGNEEVFNHFTLDDDGALVIACGTEEHRTITTTGDADLTVDIVRQQSGEQSYTGDYQNGFNMNKYTITKKPIDYASLVEPYVMPSNLLYALLIQTRDINFVTEIAKLAYDSEIAIGIYDNESVSTINEPYTYKKLMAMNAQTSLYFGDVNTTWPEITRTHLNNAPYTPLLWKNDATTYTSANKRGKIQYQKSFLGGKSTESEDRDANTYIGTTNGNQITALANLNSARQFTTTFNKTKIARTTPSIGIILADTWIERWRVSYTKQENTTSSSNDGKDDDVKVAEYKSNNEVLNEFNTTMKDSITSNLENYAKKLKEQAIKQIVENTDFTTSVEVEKITEDDIDISIKKQLLKEHLLGCTVCKSNIIKWWNNRGGSGNMSPISFNSNMMVLDLQTAFPKVAAPIDTQPTQSVEDIIENNINVIYNELNNTASILYNGMVKKHYTEIITNYINQENEKRQADAAKAKEQNEEELKKQFEEELNAQIKYFDSTNANMYTLTATKYDVDITFTSTTTTTTTQYKKDQNIQSDKEGENFKEIFNKNEYHESRQAMLQRDEWFWGYIRKNEDTAKIEDVLRYLLNIATNSTHFGSFTEEDIQKILEAFEPKEEMMQSAQIAGIKLLTDYIRRFENDVVLDYINGKIPFSSEVGKYINEEKTEYYIRDDGAGNLAIGFGVDIYNSDVDEELKAMGYSLEEGSAIPVDIIDGLEKREIEGHLKTVIATTEGLNLKLYQIYALTSRAYNCGDFGAMGTKNGKDFLTAYNDYYDPDRDDKYGGTEGDFNHNLYVNYMSTPTKSNGKEYPGLVRRRKSEWTLFQTGYMDILETWCGMSDYPDGIQTFEAAGYTFPEYPQTSRVGNGLESLYANERYGDPAYGKTLGSSGCGTFSLATIVSGLLSDASIDPISVRDNNDEFFGYSYYVAGAGSSLCIYQDDYINKYYGLHANTCNNYNTAINALKEGKCAIALEPGHFVAVIPVPNEFQGKGYEFFVIDSARGHTGPYSSASDFMAKTGQKSFSFVAIISP